MKKLRKLKAKEGILMSVFGFGLCLFVTGLSFGLGKAYNGTIFLVLSGACALYIKGYIDDLKVELRQKPVLMEKTKGQWEDAKIFI